VGDQVLITVARLLEAGLATVAPDGFVARMGGEEFLIALPGLGPGEAAGRLDGLRVTVRSHDWQPVVGAIPVTVSIGVAGSGGPPVADQVALLKTADGNLYAAKHAGRDRVIGGTE
jgi:diguanylate cyclase (GGDEF)-like protein